MPIKRKVVKHKRKKISTKKMQRGSIGSFFVYIILIILIIAGISAVGGLPSQGSPTSGQVVTIVTPTTGATYSNLQMKTFGYITLAPSPTLAPPPPDTPGQPMPPTALCRPGGLNVEPEIIASTVPANGQSVSGNGKIKIWVFDERAPMIAPNEKTNSDGSISNPGQQTVKAPDTYLYEPAIYLDSHTAESGGSPHFPQYVKGKYNNNPKDLAGSLAFRNVVQGAAIDPVPAGAITSGCIYSLCYKAEYIWNVANLGLSQGTHRAEFVIHDGDVDRGIGCVNIQIQ